MTYGCKHVNLRWGFQEVAECVICGEQFPDTRYTPQITGIFKMEDVEKYDKGDNLVARTFTINTYIPWRLE